MKHIVKRKPEVSTSASRAWFLQSLARSYIKNVIKYSIMRL